MKLYKILFCFFLILFQGTISAQNLKNFKISQHNFSNHSVENINLPIWDDFSSSDILNNLFWSEGENISINDYYNADAPSINVIEFDGLNNSGSPYNNESGYGVCDVLISDEINLKSKSVKDSIYLSFFWNFNINGEFPDYEDTLKVDFLNEDNEWINVWNTNGGILNFNDQFIYNDILVENNFFHENFMFKIYNQGNSEGPYDSWLIDYIYLNENRKKNDSIFLDRSISHKSNKIFKDHISIPIDHILNSDPFVDSISIKINNLDNNIQPINYTFKSYYDSFEFLIYNNEPLSPILGGFEKRIIKSKPINISDILNEKDSSSINFLFFIESGDSSYVNQNLKSNDSMRFTINFSDYYAYDDGSAEFAAGLNQKNSELVLKHQTFAEDTLTHIKIYFPFNLYSSYNSNIELVIYKDLQNENSKIVSQISQVSFDNNYQIYELNNPVIVKDSFYVGFRQLEDNFLPVGLDKNNNTSDKIYYKIDNNWYKNDIIEGSLMIRPIFRNSDYILTGTESEKLKNSITIFPNPSNGIFHLSKLVESIKVFDLTGKLVFSNDKSDSIDLTNKKNGIYFVQIKDSQIIEKLKLIKN
tara:strand:+ start:19546 stop:21309 length:1764 start_codon:yes stop_codon:yes gene_type:complete